MLQDKPDDTKSQLRILGSTFGFMQGNVLILTIARVLLQFFFGLTMGYVSLYVLALKGSVLAIGVVNSLGSLANLILSPIGGYIADYRGRVKLVGYGTYIYACTYIFFAFAGNWETMALGMFLKQMVLLSYLPAHNAIMADSLPPKRRGIGYATTMAIPGVVGIVAPYLGGYLIDSFGVINAQRASYIFGIGISIVAATLRLKFLKETLRGSNSKMPLKKIPRLFITSFKSVWETLKWMPSSLRTIAIITIINIFFASIASPFWIVYATSAIGLTAGQWGLIILISGALRISLMIPIGSLVDRYGRRRMIISGIALSILPVFLFTRCSTFFHVLLINIIIAMGNLLATPAFSSFIADIVPRDKRGRIMSALGQGSFLVMGAGPGAPGFLASSTVVLGSFLGGFVYGINRTYPWYILSVALILSLILCIKFVYEPKRAEV